MELEVFITKEDDGSYDVDVFDVIENERVEDLTAGHVTFDEAIKHVGRLATGKHHVDFKGVR